MRYFIFLGLVLFLGACRPSEEPIETVEPEIIWLQDSFDLSYELAQGAWRFTSVTDRSGHVLLDGSGQPEMLLFFRRDKQLTGRLKGHYEVFGNEEVLMRAEIDTIVIGAGVQAPITRIPQRYYDLEAILKPGIQGRVNFMEDGWDSKFTIQYQSNRWIWFEQF